MYYMCTTWALVNKPRGWRSDEADHIINFCLDPSNILFCCCLLLVGINFFLVKT